MEEVNRTTPVRKEDAMHEEEEEAAVAVPQKKEETREGEEEERLMKLVVDDPWLKPHNARIRWRYERFLALKNDIEKHEGSLQAFGSAYKDKLGLIKTDQGVYYREWAPGATELYLVGDFSDVSPPSPSLSLSFPFLFVSFLHAAGQATVGVTPSLHVEAKGALYEALGSQTVECSVYVGATIHAQLQFCGREHGQQRVLVGVSFISDVSCPPTDGWNRDSHKMEKNEHGVWSIFVPNAPDGIAIPHGSKLKV